MRNLLLAGNKYVERVREVLKDRNAEILVIAGAIEAEIAELESDEDRLAFLKDAGLDGTRCR
ncbi:MAG: hypothetical protein MZV63_37820 [Marinilabiliales bacterium]|nr:hypothetical protein [Marinilabiliales bacterium]